MPIINAIIRERSADSVSVDVRDGCPGCSSRGCETDAQVRQIQLPFSGRGANSERITIGLRTLDGLRLLWHSWFLPLTGLLFGALGAEWLAVEYFALPASSGGTDSLVLAGGVLGFGLGLQLCRSQPENKITINEVID